jgi:hypothetical protein
MRLKLKLLNTSHFLEEPDQGVQGNGRRERGLEEAPRYWRAPSPL